MSDMIIKQPDGGYHVADASNLTKKDWHRTISYEVRLARRLVFI